MDGAVVQVDAPGVVARLQRENPGFFSRYRVHYLFRIIVVDRLLVDLIGIRVSVLVVRDGRELRLRDVPQRVLDAWGALRRRGGGRNRGRLRRVGVELLPVARARHRRVGRADHVDLARLDLDGTFDANRLPLALAAVLGRIDLNIPHNVEARIEIDTTQVDRAVAAQPQSRRRMCPIGVTRQTDDAGPRRAYGHGDGVARHADGVGIEYGAPVQAQRRGVGPLAQAPAHHLDGIWRQGGRGELAELTDPAPEDEFPVRVVGGIVPHGDGEVLGVVLQGDGDSHLPCTVLVELDHLRPRQCRGVGPVVQLVDVQARLAPVQAQAHEPEQNEAQEGKPDDGHAFTITVS